jgi:hypothetical protein
LADEGEDDPEPVVVDELEQPAMVSAATPAKPVMLSILLRHVVRFMAAA